MTSTSSGIHGGAGADRWMAVALEEAAAAAVHGDVPIGAVVVGPVSPDPASPDAAEGPHVELARAHNRREIDGDPTAHAEILALREAARRRGTWRLDGCTLYVTLEPCSMCAGALVLARIHRLVIAADDPKAGAVGGLWDIPRDPRLNHRVEVVRGVSGDAASHLLRRFFAERR